MYSNYNDKYLNSFRNGAESPYFDFNRFNSYTNINTIQTRNNILKSQYPEIYHDINNIINDILPRYRNMTHTEELINNITEEILTIYIDNMQNENKTNKNNNNDTNKRNDLLKDLIKIILITRLIKFNLDNTNNLNRNDYYGMPYGFNMQNDMNNLYMGYMPKNYF